MRLGHFGTGVPLSRLYLRIRFGVLSNRFGTVPGLFEVPDSPTAFVSGFPAAGFDFPGQIWYVSVVAVAHVVGPGGVRGR